MTSLFSCCTRFVNQNKRPTLLHGRADVTTRYFQMDYNCFVNQLWHKMEIICKKGVTCKQERGDFNFSFEPREGDLSRYKVRISVTSPGLVSPDKFTMVSKLK